MSTILAVDPGNTESAYVVIDADTRQPLGGDKIDNHDLIDAIRHYERGTYLVPRIGEPAHRTVIEMVASYGMPVGREVFDTCVYIGQLREAIYNRTGTLPDLITRQPVKLHHCHDSRAKDSNIVQALVDRFTPGQPNRGKGTKREPGWFHGFHSDIWQSYALAVYAADLLEAGDPPYERVVSEMAP